MKKLLTPAVLMVLAAGLATSPTPARASLLQLFREDGPYADMISAAEYHQKAGNSEFALRFYRLAEKKAATDEERAKALLGIGRHTRVQYAGYELKDAGKLKKEPYEKVLALPNVPPAAKIEALFGLAETNAVIGSYDAALGQLKQISTTPQADAAQVRRADLLSGEILVETKRFQPARDLLEPLTKRLGLPLEDKISAHYTIALSHLRQVNFSDGLAEIAKINNLPGVENERRVDLHIRNGNMLSEAGHYKGARDEYTKATAVPTTPPFKMVQTQLRIGESYFREANYSSARQTWQNILTMPEGDSQASSVWEGIAISYLSEKNLPAAREAYGKLVALPKATLDDKVKATVSIANTYVQAKEYAKARETLNGLPNLLPTTGLGQQDPYLSARNQLKIVAMRESASIYRVENNLPEAQKLYVGILEMVPVNKNGNDPGYYYQVREQMQKIAGELAQVPASMDVAYAMYETLEKIYPYEKNDAEAYIGMGDILAAKGKKAEAREKYQKAQQLRANYDEGKIAGQKLAKLGP